MNSIEIALLGVALALLAIAGMRVRKDELPVVYRLRSRLFSPEELTFLGLLEQAAGRRFRVFAKVRLGDLLAPPKTASRSERIASRNRISGKHFDYLLCDADDLTVRCAIQLNDASHLLPDEKRRDAFLKEACASAGLPLVMFDARFNHTPEQIANRIAEALAVQPTRPLHIGTYGGRMLPS